MSRPLPTMRPHRRPDRASSDSVSPHPSPTPTAGSGPGVPEFLRSRPSPGAVPAIQRQEMDAGVTPAPEPSDAGESLPGGVPTSAPSPSPNVCPDPLPEFPARTTYIDAGNRFTSEYTPTGPEPNVDPVNIAHRIHIEFRPFSPALIRENPRLFGRYRGVRFTAAQRAAFTWTETEQTSFRQDFQNNVSSVWSARHLLVTNEPCFARYRARPEVRIEFVEDPARAHSQLIAYKMPPDTARLRSEVTAGRTATLESRDAAVAQTNSVAPADIVRQAGPFDFDKADVNPDVEADIQDAAAAMRPHLRPSEPEKGFADAACLTFTGRASSEGNASYNERLGGKRATAVQERLYTVLGVDATQVKHTEFSMLTGERNATTDPKFRRVDIMFTLVCGSPTGVNQNVAAHEFGHLLGFGDEYQDERPPSGVVPKFAGDRPTHYGDVEAALGTEAANELLVQNSGSIMSQGNEVRRGHYVYFLQSLSSITGKSWTVA